MIGIIILLAWAIKNRKREKNEEKRDNISYIYLIHIIQSAKTLNIYQTSTESSSVIPQWTVYGDIKFNNGPTVSTTSVTVIDSSEAIILDATESYPLSYIQQLMFLPAGDYKISLYKIILNDPSNEPSKSYI